jgi:NADPH-dependent 2,4-dienoyl-CoA reductase/sulfur reductase-like enzyme
MNSQRRQFEIVVVGAGPAGMAAACVAAEAGRQVALLDNSPWLGGQIWRGEQQHPEHAPAQRWIQRLTASGAQVFSLATAFAAPAPGCLMAETPTDVLEFTWQKLILATGARELFVPFPGWTLPGVLGPGGLHAMSKAGWPTAGKRVVVAGTGPVLLAVADGLKQHGANVRFIAEQATLAKVMRFGLGLWRHPGKLAQGLAVKARLLGVPYRGGCWPVKAEGAGRVERVTFTDGARTWTEDCDYLACGFHLVPNVELPLLLDCELAAGAIRVNEFQETSTANVFCAGEPTGIGGAECALVEGQVAGLAAAGLTEPARPLFGRRASWHRFRDALKEAFSLRPELRRLAAPDTVVCRCEDVTRGAMEPFADWRAAKLHTRCGMGPCQGRTCLPAAKFLFGWDNDSVRPPLFPVSVGALISAEIMNHNQTPSTTKPGV